MIDAKRGQMEAFGLAVIVILIALGILFTLQFTVLSPKQEVRKPFVEQQLASNLLGAILVTSVKQDCPGADDFTDLFTDYARCDLALTCSNNRDSYKYLNDELRPILEKTLNASNKKYKFVIKVPESVYASCRPGTLPDLTIEHELFADCGDITPARYFLPLGVGFPTATVDLSICG